MDKRTQDVNKLRFYTEEIDKDLTMILQSLQWNRKHIIEHPTMVSCKYDSNHQILADSIEDHEQKCLLRRNGYVKEDQLLPDPLSTAANTLIKLSKEDIAQIIKDAANSDPTFIKGVGVGSVDLAPQTLRRLQCTYSMDERRAIHDAVVAAAPACHDLTDLALPSIGENDQEKKTKSRTEILAELRDMRRRRTKYRVAAKSRNYSDVLRDVIKTQLEMYNEVLGEIDKKQDIIKLNVNKDKQTHPERNDNIRAKVDDKKIREDNREVTKRYRDNEKYTSEKPNKDKSSKDYRHKEDRNDGGSDRCHRYRNSSREMRVDKRHNSDHKTRDKDRNRRHRSRSRERHSDRSKESRSDGRRDRDYRAAGKHDRQHREHKERDRIREHERYRHGDKNEHRDSDTDRARNLLTQIKREIDSGDDASDLPNNREKYETCGVECERSRHEYNNVHINPDTAQIQLKRQMESGDEATDVSNNRDTYRTPIEKKVEKDRNIFEEGSGYESNSHSHSNSFYSYNRSKDRNTRDRNKDYRRHPDKRESDLKYYRDEHTSSYRDGSYDREVKRSLVEEKHRAYSEIYAELERQRNKKS